MSIARVVGSIGSHAGRWMTSRRTGAEVQGHEGRHHPQSEGLVAWGLTKRYAGQVAADDVSFTVRSGEIAGFLGPNGSGKSTTMRMLVGLSRPDRGQAILDGVPVPSYHNPGLRLGALLDASAIHGGRSVRETMRITTQTLGLRHSTGDEWLARVGLASVARRRAGTLSLGMRQRLGLAVACVGSPRYLVLDEPMNGLDTEGIGWVKALLRHLADDGVGVLISTHLIAEIEDVADRVVVIDRGRVVVEADPRELGSTRTVVRSADDAALIRALEMAGHTAQTGPNGITTGAPTEVVGRVALLAAISLVELRQERPRLASFVLDNTTGEFAARDVLPHRATRGRPTCTPTRDLRSDFGDRSEFPEIVGIDEERTDPLWSTGDGGGAEGGGHPRGQGCLGNVHRAGDTRPGLLAVREPRRIVATGALPAVFLVAGFPVIGVLLLTSEWGQRTAMTTFRLVPRRSRVLAAKVAAALTVSLATVSVLLVVCLAVTALLLASRGHALTASGLGENIRLAYVSVVTATLFGLAWGALLRSTPVALVFTIVVLLVVDLALAVALRDLAPWFSSGALTNWLLGEVGFSLPVVTSMSIWYVAPLAVGSWLQTRWEVR